MLWDMAILTLLLTTSIYGIDQRIPVPAVPEGPEKQVILTTGPANKPQYSPDLNVNLLEPQFQYPGFNYVPEKQPYPRVQPPVVFYAGAAPPGQQFLLRPGAPPGNFLVPQPQPQPGIIIGSNPQGPVFVAGYPKPAHIPPIEKDAEEVPNLAGNHPVTGRPAVRPTITARKPEKLETLDEPISPTAGEADVLAAADKNPSIFPKKSTPTLPSPGQSFFILNGHPLFANYPQPQTPTTVHQPNPEIYVYRQARYNLTPQEVGQVPVQDLFVRNAITGQISNVKPFSAGVSRETEAAPHFAGGNFISLNRPDDFRHHIFLKNVDPVAISPQISQERVPLIQNEPILLNSYPELKPESLKYDKLPRLAKELDNGKQSILLNIDHYSPIFLESEYSRLPIAKNYYGFSNLRSGKEEDDTVVIDAKVQNDNKESEEITPSLKTEEPSLSQAQPTAIALAGKGGVASAGPKGTALAGAKGLAVARPHATAVAGPTKEEAESEKKKL